MIKRVFMPVLLILLAAVPSFAQKETPGATRKDSTVPKLPVKIKPYKDVITAKAVTQKGLLTVHLVDDRYYFEMADSVLDQQILAVTRLAKTIGGGPVYGGEIARQSTIEFEKGPDNKIFMKLVLLISTADTTNTISQAVANSYMNPISAVFPIVAYGDHSCVIDITDFLKGDNYLLSLPAQGRGISRELFKITGYNADMSYIKSVHTYPVNTELRTIKTYNTGASMGTITLEMNTSLLQLPKIPMRQRLFDPRVGYFADDYMLFGDDQQRVKKQEFAIRWRLEPKPEDMEKYKRGELVEPAKPIVYYIDPATPKKWRPYLIQGINDWQKAFEQAGFKNAIIGKEWPEKDTSMSLEDARFSVLRYFASSIPNAYGPNVHDPRSGEILESHIGWYHNVMTLVHDWYLIQCGPVDPRARKMVFDDSLMGELIRFVSSHEVGHTLGLRHNMGASCATPVEKLRDKAWVEAHGHTPSIMDYARFNYVAQPEDNISEAGLFPRINDYDKWAIQWGYTYTGESNPEKDKQLCNRWTLDSLKNPRLWFGGEGRNNDPRSQTEDLGDDAIKASTYGIKNLKRVMKNLIDWTREPASTYENLDEMYTQAVNQYAKYVEHVTVNIGGIYETLKGVEQPGSVYAPVPKEKQRQAMAFLQSEVFDTPKWLLDSSIMDKVYPPSIHNGFNTVENTQFAALQYLLASTGNMGRLRANEERFGKDTYTMSEMLDGLTKGIFKELPTHVVSDPYRRNLQDAYVEYLSQIINPGFVELKPGAILLDISSKLTDEGAVVSMQLTKIREALLKALPLTTDPITKAHWSNLTVSIKKAMEKNK